MLNKIALISIIGLCFNLVGCGKAKITSDCTLAGSGDYKCHFQNKGTAEGSTCVNLVLVKNQNTNNLVGKLSELGAELGTAISKASFRLEMSSRGEKKEAYDDLKYARLAFRSRGLHLSNEICSGLVKANDIREINGTVFFSEEDVDWERRPVDICKGADSWTEICSFKTVSPEEIKKFVQETESEIRNEETNTDKKN